MEIKDQIDRTLTLRKVPQRIVSLVPSQTELLVDLGLNDQLVGITKFCVHPKRLLKEKQIVGGTKAVHFDKIKALKPDIVLCNKEENTREIVEGCRDICPVHVSDISTLDDNYEMIKQYGDLFQVEEVAKELISKTSIQAAKFKKELIGETRPKVAYLIWRKPYMVAGGDTFINTLLEEAGFKNAYKTKERYPEINLTELKEKNLDYVFLSTEPFPFSEKYKEEFEEYFKENQLQIVDGEFFSWYGSRVLKAYSYFEELREKLS